MLWVHRGQYWLVELSQYTAVLVGTWSEQGISGCQCDMLSENIWFIWCKPSHYSIFGEGKSADGQMDKQTDRQNFLSKTRPLPYIDLLNLRFGGAPSSLVLERLSTEQAHFLLFTKLSHLIFARTGSTRLGTVHQCCA